MSRALESLKSIPLAYAAIRRFFSRDNPCFFARIPDDVFLGHVFPHLLVEEIISMRLTCKAFYILTHEPVIWKRFLDRIQLPVTQLRPTFKYTAKSTDYEIETIVTSACALDRLWRAGFPRINDDKILMTRNKVVDLKLLPGGKFLVASVKDRCNFRFFILVYALDVMHGSRLLARLPTFYKVFNLQAKYMYHDGKPGIMISYTRRRFKNGTPANLQQNINDFYHGTPVDIHHPLLYEACSVHMPLEPVEILIRPDLRPKTGEYTGVARDLDPPFVDVLRYETESEIHSPTLFMNGAGPCMAFVEDKSGRSVVQIIELATRARVMLNCADVTEYAGMPHRIRAIRYLPCQSGILVVRSVSTTPGESDIMVFETYDLPASDEIHEVSSKRRWECRDHWQLHGEVVISDSEPPIKMAPDHPDIRLQEDGPPTIWIFAPSDNPKGCTFWWFRADPDPTAMDRWEYNREPEAYHRHNGVYHERALPGTERTLYLEIDKGISESSLLCRMRRFHFPTSRFPNQYPTKEICVPVTNRPKAEALILKDITSSEYVGNTVNKLGGLIAITWDESSGKICLAAEKEDAIRVYNTAPIAECYDKLAHEWRQALQEQAQDNDR
ncbi:hypothetical protein GALMADRAFT_234511 [Galerina marginata CBS 339.88]|uniref:F-box domain-containing protein n=1 Tax=Galerina marginata (strain CBS 339.88) TaxID=685588 RepID=A0A067TQU3_GALM3|nr:hypothetical protein GALMADRAFT_234511 [Galerina marginata CBS 339.88]